MTTILGEFSEPVTLRDSLERLIGRSFAGARMNLGWPNDGGKVGGYLLDAYARGQQFAYRNANTEPWTWASVTAGDHDTAILTSIDAMIAEHKWHRGLPLALSLHHEQTVDSGPQPQMGTAADYAPMFEHIYNLVSRRLGHTFQGGPIALTWTPSMIQYADPTDDMAVDKIGLDPALYHFQGVDWYNKHNHRGELKHADGSDIQHVIDYAVSRHKLWLIGEFGCIEDPGKAAFLDDALGRIARGGCWALFVTNKVTAFGDMRPDSNPQAAQVFKRWAGSPSYSRVPS